MKSEYMKANSLFLLERLGRNKKIKEKKILFITEGKIIREKFNKKYESLLI